MIGNGIKKVRALKGITQAELSEMAGISKGSLSRYENNKQIPPKEMFQRIANALQVNKIALVWYSLDSEMVDGSKVEAFELLKPTIDRIVEEEFIKNHKSE